MDRYFLITQSKYDGMMIDIEDEKKSCEKKLVEREKNGYCLVRLIKGRDLTVKPKKVVVEYEIDETYKHQAPKVSTVVWDE